MHIKTSRAGWALPHTTELNVDLCTKVPPMRDLGVPTDLGIVVCLHMFALVV